jgi:tetratricopeptide (TPR) repeat protein
VAFDRSAVLRQAEKLAGLGKMEPAIAEYRRVLDDQPHDWKTANTLGDLCVRAGYIEQAVQHFARVADHLHGEGFFSKAAALYKKILKHQPTHEHALLQAADIAARAGLLADARAQLHAVATLRRERRDAPGVARILIRLAALDPDDVAARRAGAQARADLGDAQTAVQELRALAAHLLQNNRHDVAIQTLHDALALDPADADVRVELDRALARSGTAEASVPVPIALGAAAERPAVAPVTVLIDEPPVPAPPIAARRPTELPVRVPDPSEQTPPVTIVPRVMSSDAGHKPKTAEIDLTVILEEIRKPAVVPAPAPPAPAMPTPRTALPARPEPPPLSADIEEAFAQLREEAGSRSPIDAADQDFTRGMLLLQNGDADAAAPFLESAVRMPRFRFEAASALARISTGRQQTDLSIEWMERAAEAPPTTPEAGYSLLFDLADALESIGEHTRALAIYLELQVDAGDFRDLAERVDRLLKVQAE